MRKRSISACCGPNSRGNFLRKRKIQPLSEKTDSNIEICKRKQTLWKEKFKTFGTQSVLSDICFGLWKSFKFLKHCDLLSFVVIYYSSRQLGEVGLRLVDIKPLRMPYVWQLCWIEDRTREGDRNRAYVQALFLSVYWHRYKTALWVSFSVTHLATIDF